MPLLAERRAFIPYAHSDAECAASLPRRLEKESPEIYLI